MASGAHEVEVTAPASRPYAVRFDVRAGETRSLYVSLEPERRALPLWPFVAGASALAVGAAVGGYFLFQTREVRGPAPQGSLGSVTPEGH